MADRTDRTDRAPAHGLAPDSLDAWQEDDAEASPFEREESAQVLRIATAVLTGHPRAAAQLPDGWGPVGQDLVLAYGHGVDLDDATPTERLAALDRAERRLVRALQIAAYAEGGNRLITALAERLTLTRATLFRAEQRRRVDASVLVGGVALEADVEGPEAVDTMYELERMLERYARAAGVTLPGETLATVLAEPSPGGATAGKARLAITALSFKTTALIGGVEKLALRTNNLAAWDACQTARATVGHTLGAVGGALGIVQNVLVLIDPDASTAAKIEGGIGLAGAGAQVVGNLGALAGWSAGAAVATAGTVVGLALAEWMVIKEVLELGAGVRMGLTMGTLNNKIRALVTRGDAIAEHADLLDRATQLAAREPDPAKAAELRGYQREVAGELGRAIDGFVGALADPPPGVIRNEWALCIPQLQEVFMPVVPFAGTRDPARLLTAATLVLDRIGYVILQRERIAFAMTTDQPVAAVPVGGE